MGVLSLTLGSEGRVGTTVGGRGWDLMGFGGGGTWSLLHSWRMELWL